MSYAKIKADQIDKEIKTLRGRIKELQARKAAYLDPPDSVQDDESDPTSD
jgi:hypothetical protein